MNRVFLVIVAVLIFAVRGRADVNLDHLKVGDEGAPYGGGGSAGPGSFEVISVIDEKTVLCTPWGSNSKIIFMLTGVDAKELADGSLVSIEGRTRQVVLQGNRAPSTLADNKWLKVEGTKTYTSASGAKNTVFLVRVESDQHFKDRMEKIDQEAAAKTADTRKGKAPMEKRQPKVEAKRENLQREANKPVNAPAAKSATNAALDNDYHLWHDRTGWFDINAKVLSIKKGKDDDGNETILVTLRRKSDNGTGLWEVTLPIETFHPHNQKELMNMFDKINSGRK
jgi:hypothetical protein